MIIIQNIKLIFASTESGWLRVNPWGIRRLLKWIKDRYGNPPVYVTENGVSDKGEMMDYSRARYYTLYINEVLKGKSTKPATAMYVSSSSISINNNNLHRISIMLFLNKILIVKIIL